MKKLTALMAMFFVCALSNSAQAYLNINYTGKDAYLDNGGWYGGGSSSCLVGQTIAIAYEFTLESPITLKGISSVFTTNSDVDQSVGIEIIAGSFDSNVHGHIPNGNPVGNDNLTIKNNITGDGLPQAKFEDFDNAVYQPGTYWLVLTGSTNARVCWGSTKFVDGNSTVPESFGYWNFNEGSGLIAHDSSGYFNDGNITRPHTTWVPGKFGTALHFDARFHSGVIMSDSSIFNVPEYTIMGWIQIDNILGFTTIFNNHNFVLYKDAGYSGKIVLQQSADLDTLLFSRASPLQENVWTHIAITNNGSEVKLYINGNAIEFFFEENQNTLLNSNGIGIGGFSNNTEPSPQTGASIDEVKFFNHALSASEIATAMTESPTGGSPIVNVLQESIQAAADDAVMLDASGSYDPDGQIVYYFWERLPDHQVLCSGPQPTCEIRALGRAEEKISLEVYDNDGNKGTKTLSIFYHAPTPPGPICGNGTIEAGEVCDSNNQSCTIGGYGGTQNCNAQCSGFAACITTEYCGDGTKNGTEQCDDHNTVSGDGCSTSCVTEFCGDGTVQAGLGEQCEGSGTQACTINNYNGLKTCSSCHYGSCVATQFCGDGIVNGTEACDDHNTVSGDGCSSTCTVESIYNLRVSTSSNRSNSVLLSNQTVTGIIYVFTSPDTNVKTVDFYLDNPTMNGSPKKTEVLVPFDFAGTSTSSTSIANPYDTHALSNGTHNITAKITLTNSTTQVVSSNFTVSN